MERAFDIWQKPSGLRTKHKPLCPVFHFSPTLGCGIPHTTSISYFLSHFSSSECMALSFLCPCFLCATTPPHMSALYLLQTVTPPPIPDVPTATQSLKLMLRYWQVMGHGGIDHPRYNRLLGQLHAASTKNETSKVLHHLSPFLCFTHTQTHTPLQKKLNRVVTSHTQASNTTLGPM